MMTDERPPPRGPALSGERRRRRYLEAAARTFIRLGYEGASMRLIAAEAGTHTGVLTYHWENKEALFRDVFDIWLGPVQADQREGLETCRRQLDRGGPIGLRDVIAALIEPSMIVGGQTESDAEHARLLYGRALTEPSEVVVGLMAELFQDTTVLLVDLVRRLLPHYDDELLHWLFASALGVSIFPQSFGERVSTATERPKSDPDWRRASSIVIDFVVRGLEVPDRG